ncbi:MAG: FAD-dependent oxidoreductase [Chloroflexi bacterium]|nr:FAD-dependent oxidoreductase [Chloroflexota bacterium]MCI0574879.1 FAD-dependent oxidoreductase [Chloroflexota bacterium]MCI0648381.1 FAD-dependent oxidoreductase [Chloroflexota bacterium]MCI0727502.1 FAD-dependent oxidoreductase [Chloroflexota bacterium]
MTHYAYLIIGGGMTAGAAAAGIREVDKTGAIGIIAAEHEPPYDRPPLSKQLWTGRKQLEAIYHELPPGVDLQTGRLAQQLDPEQKKILDDRGDLFTYDKLLLATGSTPRQLPFGKDNIIYFRTANDYRHLRRLSDTHQRFAVIGGGFIGSEIAAALALQGKQVTMIFPEKGIGSALFPADLAAYLNEYYRQKQVEVLAGTAVTGVTGSETDLTVVTNNGRSLQVHGIVAGIGVKPNTTLAEKAGLAVDNGILVNERLQTSHPHIFAAGDVANYPDTLLGVRRRVEHEDAAKSMGQTAGRVMAGADVRYDYSPMFYSDLFDLGYEAIGELDARLDTVADWQEPYQKGVIYYLQDGRIRAVLLWNVWGKVDEARQLIATGRQFTASALKGYLS